MTIAVDMGRKATKTNKKIKQRENTLKSMRFEPVHEISNNVVCATSKASDQPVQMHSLIRAFASRLSIL